MYFVHVSSLSLPFFSLRASIQEQKRGDTKLNEWTVKFDDVNKVVCEGTYGSMTSNDCSKPANGAENQARGDFNKVQECVKADDKSGMVLDDALQMCYKSETDAFPGFEWLRDGDKSRIFYYYDYEYGEGPHSIADFAWDTAYYCTGQDGVIYVSEGADAIVKREYQYYGIDRCVCSNAYVEEINFLESGCTTHCIEVEADVDGSKETYQTKQVIVTTSVGVLAHKGEDFGIFKDKNDPKYKAMMDIYFDPDTAVTKRSTTGNIYNP